MDPDSGPKNTLEFSLVHDKINKDRVVFDEVNGEKRFYLANLNECTHSVVTCNANFDDKYKLLSCEINIVLLDSQYNGISRHDSELSLDDLFKIADQFYENERLSLSFDGQKISSFMVGKNYKTAVDMDWIFSYACREDVFNYMDINDKMLDYLYAKLSKRKRYRDIKPFKLVELNYLNSQNFTLLKKAK